MSNLKEELTTTGRWQNKLYNSLLEQGQMRMQKKKCNQALYKMAQL
jgi:hypothetical protein